MATKTLALRCPCCGKKLSSNPQNDYCAIHGQPYGNPNETCPKCKKGYRNIFVIEAADELTLADKVSFWITSTRTLVAFIIAAVFGFLLLTLEIWLPLVLIIALYPLLCALTQKNRQAHKDRVLAASRERLKDPKYFARYLMLSAGLSASDGLTAEVLIPLHSIALSAMEKDQPLKDLQLASSIRQAVSRKER